MKVQNHILALFNRLLADVSHRQGVRLDPPETIHMDWVLIEGPKLDKMLLMTLELDALNESAPPYTLERAVWWADYHGLVWPEWIKPLLAEFLEFKTPRILKDIRMLLVFGYKAELPPTNAQIQEAQASFINIDAAVAIYDAVFEDRIKGTPLLRRARSLVQRALARLNLSEIIPHNGPGGTFPSRVPSEKSCLRHLYPSIQQYYPIDQIGCALPNFWHDVLVSGDETISVQTEIVSKVTAVPKDSRGPRLICVHPAEAVSVQLGIADKIIACIESSPLTRDSVRFSDQTVNGLAALESSLSGELTTLDLKDASDHMSCKLVEFLFGSHLYARMACCRASHAIVGDRRIELSKFAPMGNGLTFPVQSIVYWALVKAGIECMFGTKAAECTINVFGDDIEFPSVYYDGAINGLIRGGFIANMGKTFRKGSFRESCGVDAWEGVDVTPLRLKVACIKTVEDAYSLADLAGRLRRQKYTRTAQHAYNLVETWLGKKLCYSNNPTSVMNRYVDVDLLELLHIEKKARFNRALHRYEVPSILLRGVSEKPRSDAWWHLQDSLVGLERTARAYREVPFSYPVPHRVRSKCGWTPVVERRN